jgi:hypothetical protein|uniref:Glycosyltransferase n=1 Tax=viral metagenome TaxID=1070528 RepID=A0A6C0K4X4_9ZZZZ
MLDAIEKIYVLKLAKNDGTVMEEHLQKRFPGKPVQFWEVEGKTVNKNEGSINLSLWRILCHNYVDEVAQDITKNHMAMIRDAHDSGEGCVLFLEEDARFEEAPVSRLKGVSEWLKNSPMWDIFFLGYCNWPLVASFFVTTNVVKLWSPLNAHAYILNRRGMQKILNYTENGQKVNQHVDKIYATMPMLQRYGMFPMIAFQNKEPALFTKVCDKLNVRMSMRTLCIVNQYLSLLIPILIIGMIVYGLLRFFH